MLTFIGQWSHLVCSRNQDVLYAPDQITGAVEVVDDICQDVNPLQREVEAILSRFDELSGIMGLTMIVFSQNVRLCMSYQLQLMGFWISWIKVERPACKH